MLTAEETYRLINGDCITGMAEMPESCMDLAVFSPPFPAMFAYTDSESDMGNSEDFAGDAKIHLAFFFHQLIRVMKPGRVVCVHVQNIPAMKRTGKTSTTDFRGLIIRLAMRAGFSYEQDWPITKNPQAQSIRTRSTKLQFSSVEKDRTRIAPAFSDYIIKLLAPGDNAVPVVDAEGDQPQLTRNQWIEWAEGAWLWQAIRETDTLNTAEGKGENDTKHICPLQLPVIRRLVKMYSNPGEVVFSPFAGIGSEGYESIMQCRRFLGFELKEEYIAAAERNLAKAVDLATGATQACLF